MLIGSLTGRRCAVLGHPIAHSLSPALHRAAYAELGLDWSFDAVDVTADDLAGFVTSAPVPPWRGLALTMPLKRAVLPMLDRVDDRVTRVGGANTLLWESDGSRSGANTDVPGLVAALSEADPPVADSGSVVVLGAGATAAAAVAALAELGLDRVTLRARDAERAEPTRRVAEACGIAARVEDLDAPWSGADLLVSTVPAAVAVGVVPDAGWRTARPAVVLDTTYDPWPSPLLVRAEAAGARVVTGVDLLVHQAVEQIALMTGRRVDAAVLRTAAAAALPGGVGVSGR